MYLSNSQVIKREQVQKNEQSPLFPYQKYLLPVVELVHLLSQGITEVIYSYRLSNFIKLFLTACCQSSILY